MQKKIHPGAQRVTIEKLTPDGLGIATIGKRKVHIANALPNEEVEFYYLRRHRNGDTGIATQVIANPHPARVIPGCVKNGYCGGCSLQHLIYTAQITHHQNYLAECLIPSGGPRNWIAPLSKLDHIYGYRHKARLGVKWVAKHNSVLIGFRERGRPLITDIDSCIILHPSVGKRIGELRTLVNCLDARQAIPQIEIAVGEGQVAFIFRHTTPLSRSDCQHLINFARDNGQNPIQIFLQPGGLDTIAPLWPETPALLHYSLPNYNLSYDFRPTDFTQVNYAVNHLMVDQAVRLLDLHPQETIVDLYCGLGNFTLPIARSGARVIGIEGNPELVTRARENTRRNNLSAEFCVHDLSLGLPRELFQRKIPSLKILLDPPRTGALEIISDLAELQPERIVYISCNPETLSRDATELTRRHGYHLNIAGVIDMFPHTGHIESLAVFMRDKIDYRPQEN